jgi:hypothetical protein
LLLLGDRKVHRSLSRFEPRPEPVKHLLSMPYHGGGISEEAEFSLFGSQEHVSRNRQIWGDGQLLVDDPYACRPSLMRRMEMHGLSIERDFAAIRALCSRQDFHQRALARTILSNQSVDLTRPYREIHALERAHAGKTLSYPAYREDRLISAITWSSLGTR